MILMLAGFRSRCTMPLSCAASSASAIWLASRQCFGAGDRPLGDPLGQRVALDQLQNERRLPFHVLETVNGPMCGWLSDASIRASRSKRERRSGSPVKSRGQDLDRDFAPELGSCAR